MKPIKFALILIASAFLLSANFIEAKNKKISKKKITKSKAKAKKHVNVVHDANGFHSEINQVVRRNPTLTVETRLGAERLPRPDTVLRMSNSNTSNGENLGSFGPKAEIVGKINLKIFPIKFFLLNYSF